MSLPTQNDKRDNASGFSLRINIGGTLAFRDEFDRAFERDQQAARALRTRMTVLKNENTSLLPSQTNIEEDQADREELATHLKGLEMVESVLLPNLFDQRPSLIDNRKNMRSLVLRSANEGCGIATTLIQRIRGRYEGETGTKPDQTVEDSDAGGTVNARDSAKTEPGFQADGRSV